MGYGLPILRGVTLEMSETALGIIAIAVAVAISLVILFSASGLELEAYAAVSFWSGVAYLVVFVALNFGVERIWFPRPRPGGPPLPPLVGTARRGHMMMGAVESAVFIIGVIMVGVGMSLLGTRGYGSF
jgi:hypothetical protein